MSKMRKMNENRETAWRPTIVHSTNGKPIEAKGMDDLFRESMMAADNQAAKELATLVVEVPQIPEEPEPSAMEEYEAGGTWTDKVIHEGF
jgi:hypothetical protein